MDGDVSSQAGCPNGGLCVGMTGTGCNRRVISPCCLQLEDVTVSSGKLFVLGVFLFQYFNGYSNFLLATLKIFCVNPCISLFHNTIYIFIVYSCFTTPLFFLLISASLY